MTTRVAEIVASTESPGEEQELKSAVWLTHMIEDGGLRLYFPDTFYYKKTGGEVVRFELRCSDLRALHELQPEALVAGQLEEVLKAMASDYCSVVEFGESWEVESRVFNVMRQGLALTFSRQGEEFSVLGLPAPHAGAALVSALACPSEDFKPSAWILANLHGGFHQSTGGMRTLAISDAELEFDPATWALKRETQPNGDILEFKVHTGWATVSIELAKWGSFSSFDKFQRLVERADVNCGDRLNRVQEEFGYDYGAWRGDTSRLPRKSAPSRGATAVRHGLDLVEEGVGDWRLSVWTLRMPNHVVKVQTRWSKEYPEETVDHAGLKLEVKLGFKVTKFDGDSESMIVIENMFDSSQVLTIAGSSIMEAGGVEEMRRKTSALMREYWGVSEKRCKRDRRRGCSPPPTVRPRYDTQKQERQEQPAERRVG